jgi:Na+/H+-dicarboxylate symporter/ABC-type amino acid transport substrate-binding protein
MAQVAAKLPSPKPAPVAAERRIFVQLIAAVGLGILLGLFFGESVAPLRVVGDGMIKLLQVTVLPYLLGSILAGLGRRTPTDAKRLALRGGVVLVAFWAMSLLLVAATSLAYPSRTNGDVFFSADTPATSSLDLVALYIPSNLFNSLANNVLPAVVLFGLLAGTALGTIEASRKAALLEVLEAFNDAMTRVARFLIRITPIGVFAIAATTAGTIRSEQLVRMQLWFVVYIFSACIVSFWVLPGLVALVTPIPYRVLVSRLRNALLTAFAAGDLFIVLPIITEEGKQLLKEYGVNADEADASLGVVIPLLFNFPHTGKILSLGFLPFAAWFSGSTLSFGQWGKLASAGVLAMFGSLSGAIPFLLDMLRLPADLFALFSMSSVLNSRFGALVAAMHIAAVSLVIAVALTRGLRLHAKRLLAFAVVSVAIIALFVGGTRAVFAFVLPSTPAGIASLEGFHMRPPFTPGILKGRAQSPPVRPIAGHRLTHILERHVLRVGYIPDSIPYAFFNAGGELIGYDIELANVLARDLNASLEFVEVTREEMAEALASGACDIIMSGLTVSVNRAERMLVSRPYQQERLGFLVPDYDRSRFASLEAIQDQHLTIGIQAIDDIAPLIRQRLVFAAFVRYPSIEALVAAVPGAINAAVLSYNRAVYLSRINPELSAVLPEETTSSIMLAYGIPNGETELRNLIDTWIDIKRGQGAFESAQAYWIRGEGLRPRQPRWSIARNLLGWNR